MQRVFGVSWSKCKGSLGFRGVDMTESIQTDMIMLKYCLHAFRTYMTQNIQTEVIILIIACMTSAPT